MSNITVEKLSYAVWNALKKGCHKANSLKGKVTFRGDFSDEFKHTVGRYLENAKKNGIQVKVYKKKSRSRYYGRGEAFYVVMSIAATKTEKLKNFINIFRRGNKTSIHPHSEATHRMNFREGRVLNIIEHKLRYTI